MTMRKIKKKEIGLKFVWNIRAKLRAEGNKLWAEGNKLWAEGNKLWAEAVIEAYGNIKLEWKYVESKNDYSCTLETGEVFEP
jgi:hypothetical protein